MTLLDQIHREEHAIHGLEDAIAEARKHLWEDHFVATHDARRKGESEHHWHQRRARNREAFEHRDDVVHHLQKKKDAHQAILDKLKKDRKAYKEEQAAHKSTFDKGSTAIVYFDGHPVVEDAAWALDLIRKHGWTGYLISGYRTPAYSQSLCYAMCGAPSCPGRCAGLASNHARTTYGGPAVDISDFIRGEELLIDYATGYHNSLPYDLPHQSKSGA